MHLIVYFQTKSHVQQVKRSVIVEISASLNHGNVMESLIVLTNLMSLNVLGYHYFVTLLILFVIIRLGASPQSSYVMESLNVMMDLMKEKDAL